MKIVGSRLLPLVLVVSSVAALGASVKTSIDQDRQNQRQADYQACQASVYDAVIGALVDSRGAAVEERAADAAERERLRTVLREVRDNPRGFQGSITAYLAEGEAADQRRAEAAAARAASQLPPPPKEACASGAPAPAWTPAPAPRPSSSTNRETPMPTRGGTAPPTDVTIAPPSGQPTEPGPAATSPTTELPETSPATSPAGPSD